MDTTHMAAVSPIASGGEARPGIGGRSAQLALCALLCLSITLPVINFSESLPWFKIEQLALPLIAVVYLWFLLAGFARPFRANTMIAIAVLYAFCVALALFYGWVLLGHTVLLRDFYEIPKVFLPAAFFTLGLEAGLTETSLLRLLKWFSVAMLLVCVYAWAQWMDLGFTHFLANFYSGGSHDEGSLSHYRRVYSTMGNPNL
ncbi:MAG TPA: hypothetical protein VKB24_05690, partial [Candidatus Acidoferrum sp.]|nr:hypothetical protein [Candidatus Acidoferrum sp.]